MNAVRPQRERITSLLITRRLRDLDGHLRSLREAFAPAFKRHALQLAVRDRAGWSFQGWEGSGACDVLRQITDGVVQTLECDADPERWVCALVSKRLGSMNHDAWRKLRIAVECEVGQMAQADVRRADAAQAPRVEFVPTPREVDALVRPAANPAPPAETEAPSGAPMQTEALTPPPADNRIDEPPLKREGGAATAHQQIDLAILHRDGHQQPVAVPALKVGQMPARVLVTLLEKGGSMIKQDLHRLHRGSDSKDDPRLANLLTPSGELSKRGLIESKDAILTLTEGGRQEAELQKARATQPIVAPDSRSTHD